MVFTYIILHFVVLV